MLPISYGIVAGGIAGIIMAILIHLAMLVSVRGKHLPDIDAHYLFGRKYSAREAHLLGILIQLALSAVFGGVYVMLVDYAIVFKNFDYIDIALFGVLVWFLKGLIVTPLLGIGFFGAKEGKYVWFEMFITHQIYALAFYVSIHLLMKFG